MPDPLLPLDAAGRRLDARAATLVAGLPVSYLPVGTGQVPAEQPVSVPTGVAVTRSTGQISVAFNPVAGATAYEVQYWPTATPAAVNVVQAATSPVVVTGLNDALGYSARVLAAVSGVKADDLFIQSPFSSTSTVA